MFEQYQYIDSVILFCVISRAKYRFGVVYQFGWVVKTYKFNQFFYENSFVLGSTDFDPKFVAFVIARQRRNLGGGRTPPQGLDPLPTQRVPPSNYFEISIFS